MSYTASDNRYQNMQYRRCGKSGIQLPLISLGLWQNFGDVDDENVYRKTLHTAFDCGITHFDLANNYGPSFGAAETNFGRVFKQDFTAYRDEILISTKAGFYMWPGPYGEWGSKKSLFASLHQSLQRMQLDYVDIFYHHRPDPNTPLEETMAALDLMVRQGKALYIGISNYKSEDAAKAIAILKQLGTPCLIHQPRYSMLDRWVEEDGLLKLLNEKKYRLKRDEWSIHFNITDDMKHFCGDGGNDTQVAKAKDGMWIYYFTPQGDSMQSERLVNMKFHQYRLEPNVHFSPDGKWVIFRANFEGKEDVYAVEIKRS